MEGYIKLHRRLQSLLTLNQGWSTFGYGASNSSISGNRTRQLSGFFVPNVKFLFASGVGEYNTSRGNKPAVLIGCLKHPIPFSVSLFIQKTIRKLSCLKKNSLHQETKSIVASALLQGLNQWLNQLYMSLIECVARCQQQTKNISQYLPQCVGCSSLSSTMLRRLARTSRKQLIPCNNNQFNNRSHRSRQPFLVSERGVL